MAFKTEAEQSGEEFIEKVKRMLASKDGLIYDVESRVSKSNVISPSKIGDRYAIVNVQFFNVTHSKDVFEPHEWIAFGEMGADVDTWQNELEVSKYIEG